MSTRAPSANLTLACSADRQNTMKSIILLLQCSVTCATFNYACADSHRGYGQIIAVAQCHGDPNNPATI